METVEVRRILKQAALDPVAFFGDDIDGRYREYALLLHPDPGRGGNKDDFQKLVELRDIAKQPVVVIDSPKRQRPESRTRLRKRWFRLVPARRTSR